jgi:hypothetical protein
MPSVVEMVVVAAIVAAAGWFIWRAIRRDLSGKTSSCGCGCGAGECPADVKKACPSAESETKPR